MELNAEHDESSFVMFEGRQYEKFTPKNFLQLRLPTQDSGYSSLPPSPIKSSQAKLNRRSLSLHDTGTPFTRKSFCKRVLYRDTQDKLGSGVIKRRNSDPELTNNDSNTSKPQETKDILNDLIPFPHIISKIFSHLNGENLSAVCCVSKTWNQLCKNDKNANEKRRLFLAILVLNKENPKTRYPPPVPPRSGECTPLNNSNRPFPVPTVESRSEPTNFERFVEAAKHLPNGAYLVKCMRCCSPSQVLPSSPVASCISPTCCFRFCSRCQCQFTANHICRVVSMSASAAGSGGGSHSSSTPSLRIGSIGCRRNLRRLRL